MLTDAAPTEHHSLAEACKRVPHGVVCLLSALCFHDLTTQLPYEVWMAIPVTARQPKVDRPAMRFHRFSGAALTDGQEIKQIEGVSVKVYNPAKTVADCFKYRNKIGLDIAIEALKDCIGQRKATFDELWHYAKICRMTRVMQPYIEAIV
jgi:predicted transcriptional regulator of viral defense system